METINIEKVVAETENGTFNYEAWKDSTPSKFAITQEQFDTELAPLLVALDKACSKLGVPLYVHMTMKQDGETCNQLNYTNISEVPVENVDIQDLCHMCFMAPDPLSAIIGAAQAAAARRAAAQEPKILH